MEKYIRLIPPTAVNYDRFTEMIIATPKKQIPNGHRE